MARARRLQRASSVSSSSSSSTSPERGEDDDNDSFMLQANDSQSSLGIEDADEDPTDSQNAQARAEYEERCRVSPVARLPAELLIAIFGRLSASSDLLAVMLTSKEWARNSVGLLWHRPAMGRWESIQSVIRSIRKADKYFAYPDLVKRLNMSTLSSQVSDGVLLGLSQCKRVERLTLTNCAKLTDTSLQPLVDGNRSLLALDITQLDQLTDKTMLTVADNCLRLQGLNVTGCKKLTDASIVAVAKSCQHVKRLKFNGCAQLTDTSLMTVAAHSTHLLEIDLHGLQSIESPSVTAILTSCPHLREMRLAHCLKINDQAFLKIPYSLGPGPDAPPITFESLRILDLTDCNELGDKGVERIIETCPRLRNLILAKCRHITDRAVLAITRLSKNLHYIHLGHCQRITDVGVEALAKSCSRIRYIDLACCSNLTDASVVKLAGLPKLKRIGLVKCAGITDRSIYALAMGELSKSGKRINGISVLERVHLSYCTLLTLDGIHVLLNNCPKLTHLSLTGVQAFLRDELLTFCREAPPEFNDHQRDVFCVFSGHGVGRLRDYLNAEKAHALRMDTEGESVTGSVVGELDGMDDEDARGSESDGSNTPVISLDVHGEYPAGATPVIPGPSTTPSSGVLFGGAGLLHHFGRGSQGGAAQGGGVMLSSSAPANMGPGSFMWASQSLYPPPPPHSTQPSTSAGPMWFPPHPPPPPHGGQTVGSGVGNAQHLPGMMGATVLDDVDEGDEAFGDGDDYNNSAEEMGD